MTQQAQSGAMPAARRLFVYGDHRFDDPGSAYTTEQVRQHLVQYKNGY